VSVSTSHCAFFKNRRMVLALVVVVYFYVLFLIGQFAITFAPFLITFCQAFCVQALIRFKFLINKSLADFCCFAMAFIYVKHHQHFLSCSEIVLKRTSVILKDVSALARPLNVSNTKAQYETKGGVART